jgi:hypothetical protein
MPQAVIDASDLGTDQDEHEPPSIRLGEIVVDLPPHMPLDWFAALGNHAWAVKEGTDEEKREATGRLAVIAERLAPDLSGKARVSSIVNAITEAYTAGEESASSD